MAKMWMVRAGEKAYLISEFLDNAMIAMGWEGIGSLENLPSFIKIKEKIMSIYPEYNAGKTGMTASQLKKFRSDLAIDDYIVTYDPSSRNYHIGLVKSEYIFKEQIPFYPHQRNVEWIGKISRDILSTSTKNTLGGISTLFEISGRQKDEILNKLKGRKMKAAPPEEDIDVGSLKEDVISRSIEFIKDRL
jgi:restriction system protein